MPDREKVINGLRSIKTYLASQAIESTYDFAREGFIESQRNIDDALALLKEQEESIPVSWLTEKLEGHPELPYAVTDGINNVLDLWEGR